MGCWGKKQTKNTAILKEIKTTYFSPLKCSCNFILAAVKVILLLER